MGNENEVLRAVEAVTLAVESSPTRSLPGATLGQLLRRQQPGVLGALTVTQFLDRNAPRLTVVGRSGKDPVWGLDRDDDAPWDDLDALLEPGEPTGWGDPSGVCLERVHLVNYRSVRDAELELDDLTVLVGPNGAGKSNLLDGIFRGFLLTHRKPDSVFDGRHHLDRVTRRASEGGLSITFRGNAGWSMEFRGAAPPQERFLVTGGGAAEALPSLQFTPFSRAFGPAVRLNLSASRLAKPTYSDDVAPYLRHDGMFLPSVLDHLAGSDRPRLERIIAQVRELVPQVEDLRTPRQRIRVSETEVLRIDGSEVRRPVDREVLGNTLEVKVRGAGWTPADQLSEGTLLVIGLHTMLERDVPPKVILIDDLDRALHPNAQRRLVEQLLRIVGPQRKIVATSHSPFVLDPLPPSAVRVVQLDENDATRIGRFEDHHDWEKWKAVMTPAEFWQYAGDEWMAGAR